MTDIRSLTLPPGSPKTFWTELSLHSAGLSEGDQWAIEAITKVKALFPNQGVQHVAAWLAALHPRAIEYLEQAPVLVLAASYGGKASNRAERAYLAMNFLPLVRRGAKLKEVMAAFNVAHPFRALSSKAIRPGIWPTIRMLSANVGSSAIAQAIPETKTRHYNWIGDIVEFYEVVARRQTGALVDGEFWGWFMLVLSRRDKALPDTPSASSIADYIICNRDQWNSRWTIERLIRETEDWHDALAKAEFNRINQGQYDDEVNYGAFPVQVTIDGFEFQALRSLRALVIEGRAMRHCVASYYQDIKSGRARIYSIRKDGSRVATCEFSRAGYPGDWRLVQLKGPCNAKVARNVEAAAARFARCLNPASIPKNGDIEATKAIEAARRLR